MEKKKYSISQLASILTISETAIRKKIKGEGETKRYKERYQVVGELQNNKVVDFIMLDDIELQAEIQISKRNKNKFTGQGNVDKTPENVVQEYENVVENVDYIDVTPQVQQIDDFSRNDYLEFTKRYLDKLDNLYYTLHETQKETLEKDRQIYMLEDFEKRTKEDIAELRANNKTLEERNKTLETTFQEKRKTLEETFNNKIEEEKKRNEKKERGYKIGLLALFITFVLVVATLAVLLILEIKKPPKIEVKTVEVEKVVEKVVEKPVYKYVKR